MFSMFKLSCRYSELISRIWQQTTIHEVNKSTINLCNLIISHASCRRLPFALPFSQTALELDWITNQ